MHKQHGYGYEFECEEESLDKVAKLVGMMKSSPLMRRHTYMYDVLTYLECTHKVTVCTLRIPSSASIQGILQLSSDISETEPTTCM